MPLERQKTVGSAWGTVEASSGAGPAGPAGPAGAAGATGPAGTGSASIFDAQLAANVAAGASTITMDRSATSAIQTQGWLVVDAFTSQAEVKKINSVSGTSITFTSAVKYAHVTGDVLLVVHTGALSASLWGCKGDNSTDDVLALQEAINQCSWTDNNFWLDGQGKTFAIGGPLVGPTSIKMRNFGRIRALAAFAPSADANLFMFTSSERDGPLVFTADPGTNVITTPTAHGIQSTATTVMVKGASVPGGLVAGRTYYAKTWPTTTTLTISATDGGAEIDITSAGSGGDLYRAMNALARVYLDGVYFDINLVAGLNGVHLVLQQPAYTNWLRVDGPSSTGTCLVLRGQISVHTNTEVNGVTNGDGSILVNLGGSGHDFFGLKMVHGTDGVLINDASGLVCATLNGLWTEHMTNHVRLAAATYGLVINGWLQSFGDVAEVPMKVETADSGYSIMGARGNSGVVKLVSDSARGFDILDQEFPAGIITSFVQPQGPNAPEMPRVVLAKTADYLATIADEVILVSASGAARTITLPTAVGVTGKRYCVKKTDSSGNTVTVDPNGAQTIDGAATAVLSAQYQSLEILSDGANWMVVT